MVPAFAPAQNFLNPRLVATSSPVQNVYAADLNGDGLPDLLYGKAAGVMGVLLARSDGSYAAAPDVQMDPNLAGNCLYTDVTGDNVPDLVCGNRGAYASNQNVIGILPGKGDGTFGPTRLVTLPAATSGLGLQPTPYGAADLNGDGLMDLVVHGTDGMHVLLADGNGAFTSQLVPYDTDTSATIFAPVLQDVNGDGKADLILPYGSGIDVLLGKGDGSFLSPMHHQGGSTPFLLADADGDGILDLISATGTGLAIWHGNGDGTFAASTLFEKDFPGNGAASGFPLAYLDVNGDGIPDLITYASDGLTVFIGQGHLRFADPVHYPTGQEPVFPFSNAFVDMNGDGAPDFVAGGPQGVYITYGRGNGTFQSAYVHESGDTVGYAAVADFNGDGIPDVVTNGGSYLMFNAGKGDGTFSPAVPASTFSLNQAQPSPSSNTLWPMYHGDFNCDHQQDVIASVTLPQPNPQNAIYQSYLFPGNGDGTFGTPVPIALSLPFPHVRDMNGDGCDDLVGLSADQNSSIQVMYGRPDGHLQATTLWSDGPHIIGGGPEVADFNADGNPDLFFINTELQSTPNAIYLLGHSDGTFTTKQFPIAEQDWSGNDSTYVAGDFDGDGYADIAFAGYRIDPGITNELRLCVFYGSDLTAFPGADCQPYPANLMAADSQSADMDGDGRDDVIAHSPAGVAQVQILHSLPNRTFGNMTYLVAGIAGGAAPSLIDLNGDGKPDIVMPNSGTNAFTVVLQGSFTDVTGSVRAMPEPSQLNQPFAITAKLAPPQGQNGIALTGAVDFTVDGQSAGSAPIAGNSASVTVSTPLPRGRHTLGATWAGMAAGQGTGGVTTSALGAVTLSGSHSVLGIGTRLLLSFAPTRVGVNQQGTMIVMVEDASGAPDSTISGTLAVAIDGGAPQTISGPAVTAGISRTLIFGSPGTHTITAQYSGDVSHEPSQSSVTVQVNAAATAMSLAATPNPAPYGNPVVLTVALSTTASAGSGNLWSGGTVSFTGLPGAQAAMANVSASGSTASAQFSVSGIRPGTYVVTAHFSGTAALQASGSNEVKLVVLPAVSTTLLTATPGSIYRGKTVALGTTVQGLGIPLGTVQIMEGSTVVGTGTLTNGAASISYGPMTFGAHQFQAVYRGDANNAPSTSAPVTVQVLPPGFTITAPADITLVTGHHTSTRLTVTSHGFTGTVSLTMQSPTVLDTTTRFTPAKVALTEDGSATVQMYVDTDLVLGFYGQNRAPQFPWRDAGERVMAALLLASPFAFSKRMRRAPALRLAAMLTLAALPLFMAGCGGGILPASTPPGTYTMTVLGNGSNGEQESASFLLHVTR